MKLTQRTVRRYQSEQCTKPPSSNQTHTFSPADGIGIGMREL
jgi:hypothetical protein